MSAKPTKDNECVSQKLQKIRKLLDCKCGYDNAHLYFIKEIISS